MSNPFLGEIRMFAGNFAPRSFSFCNGQLLAISQNDALYALLGTTYGGDGQVTFGLPDLRSRIPIGLGQGPGLSNRTIGQQIGTETVTLIPSNMPAHSHQVACASGSGTSTSPQSTFWAANTNAGLPQYSASSSAVMNPASVTIAGGNQPHDNLMPILALNYIIALEGVFPSRN